MNPKKITSKSERIIFLLIFILSTHYIFAKTLNNHTAKVKYKTYSETTSTIDSSRNVDYRSWSENKVLYKGIDFTSTTTQTHKLKYNEAHERLRINYNNEANVSGEMEIVFRTAVENLSFRISDIDSTETITIKAFDENNQLVAMQNQALGTSIIQTNPNEYSGTALTERFKNLPSQALIYSYNSAISKIVLTYSEPVNTTSQNNHNLGFEFINYHITPLLCETALDYAIWANTLSPLDTNITTSMINTTISYEEDYDVLKLDFNNEDDNYSEKNIYFIIPVTNLSFTINDVERKEELIIEAISPDGTVLLPTIEELGSAITKTSSNTYTGTSHSRLFKNKTKQSITLSFTEAVSELKLKFRENVVANTEARTIGLKLISYCIAPTGYTLQGTVFNDDNENGENENEEDAIENIVVNLYEDVNLNQELNDDDLLIASVNTELDGTYRFNNVTKENVILEVETSSIYAETNATSKYVDLSETTNTSVDFGLRAPTFQLSGLVWNDANANGIIDTNEDPYPNLRVEFYQDSNNSSVLDNGDALIAFTETSDLDDYDPGKPNYILDEVPIGLTFIKVIIPGGSPPILVYIPTYDADTGTTNADGIYTGNITSNTNDVNFGIYVFNLIDGNVRTTNKDINKHEETELKDISDELILYPNPSKEYIVLDDDDLSGTLDIAVYNDKGIRVLKKTINTLQNKVKINVSRLPAGIYYAQLTTAKALASKKFLKM